MFVGRINGGQPDHYNVVFSDGSVRSFPDRGRLFSGGVDVTDAMERGTEELEQVIRETVEEGVRSEIVLTGTIGYDVKKQPDGRCKADVYLMSDIASPPVPPPREHPSAARR